MLESVQWKWRILPNIINNLNFFKNGFKKKSALGGFGLEGFWIAHTIYLMDFGVPKMGFLVLVLGVIERGVRGGCWMLRFAKESFVCRIVVPQNHLRNVRPFCSIAETRRRYLAASLADRLRYRSFAGFSSFRPRSPRAKDYSLWLDDYQTHVRCYFCYYYLPRPYYARLLGDPVTSSIALR